MKAQAKKLSRTSTGSVRARNHAVNASGSSSHGIRRSHVVMGVLGCTLILSVAANLEGINNFVNRPVSKIKLESQSARINESEVGRLVAKYIGTGFFGFDVNGLKADIERHPWVRQASVTRVWPDSVALNIQERIAIARWGDTELLSQQGERFSPPNIGSASVLPRLSGPEGSQAKVMQQFQFLNELFSPVDLRLSELTLSERGSWDLVVNDRIAIAVGREKLIERVNRFIAFYQQETDFDRDAIAKVDLRYDNGLAIARVDESLPGVASR